MAMDIKDLLERRRDLNRRITDDHYKPGDKFMHSNGLSHVTVDEVHPEKPMPKYSIVQYNKQGDKLDRRKVSHYRLAEDFKKVSAHPFDKKEDK